jgi:Na+-driven multidrug efflux pump
MVADSFAIAAQAMVGETVGGRDTYATGQLASRLLLWGLATGLGLLAAFVVGAPLVGMLVDDPEVQSLAVSAAQVAGWMMPVAAPLFVADGIFFGLLALGTVIASTGSGAATLILLIAFTPLGESLDGIWWAIGAMLVARGLVFVFGYRRAVVSAVRS